MYKPQETIKKGIQDFISNFHQIIFFDSDENMNELADEKEDYAFEL